MIKKKDGIKKSNKILLVIIAVLSLSLLVCAGVLGKTLNEKQIVEDRVRLFERCQQLGGAYANDDHELNTCISYSNVKSIDTSIKTYQDCEDDYFKREGVRLGVPAVGSDVADSDELIACEVPDGRVFYTTQAGYFNAK